MGTLSKKPVVLIVAGNDPSGGAGICADVQTVSALGCHPAPVISSLTVQDTRNAYRVDAVAAELVIEQVCTVLDDFDVAAIKFGLLGSAETGRQLAALSHDHADIPLVVDPVLVAAGGARLAEADMQTVYREQLAPVTSVLTPNAHEINQLAAPETDRDRQIELLHGMGFNCVLVTGGDEPGDEIVNTLYGPGDRRQSFTWTRTRGDFHGSGCTLASALAAYLALGRAVPTAAQLAQEYTARTIAAGWQPGKGQHVPDRMPRS